MHGKARIAKGLKASENYFDNFALVQGKSTYLKVYGHKHLPLIRDKNDFYKTYTVDSKKGQRVNFALRCATSILNDEQNSHCRTNMITVQFSEEYLDDLYKIEKEYSPKLNNRRPFDKIRKDIRRTALQKYHIDSYFLVLKRSLGAGLHIHIICNIEDEHIDDLKKTIKSQRWSSGDSFAIQIKSHYHRTIKLYNSLSSEKHMLDLDLQHFHSDSAFCEPIMTHDRYGNVYAKYKSRNSFPIDIGASDYLSKGLTNLIF